MCVIYDWEMDARLCFGGSNFWRKKISNATDETRTIFILNAFYDCMEVYHGMAYVKVGVNMAGQ